jgi:high affinity Mn2+ porin
LHAGHWLVPSAVGKTIAACSCERLAIGLSYDFRPWRSARGADRAATVRNGSAPTLLDGMGEETVEMFARRKIRDRFGGERLRTLFGAGLGAMLALSHQAFAADLPVSPPVQAPVPYVGSGYDWTGWYVGLHVGVLRGSSNWSSTPLGPGGPVLNGAFDLPFHFDFFGGTGSYVAGLQGGYNYVLPSHLMLGVEVDASVPNSDVNVPFSVQGSQTVVSNQIGQVTYGEAVIHYGSIRGRVGYAFDHLLVYGTGGFAWTYDQVTRSQDVAPPVGGFAPAGTLETAWLWRLGWAAGIGVEIPIASGWSAKAEFLETGFDRKSVFFQESADQFSSSLAMQSIRFGLNYHLDDSNPAANLIAKGPSYLETDRFAFHSQATFLDQATPPFPSPYVGPNSLNPGQSRETSDVTLYAGVKLWQGAEAWVNPEIDQGFGLSNTLGVAGFTSGEAYKVGADYP